MRSAAAWVLAIGITYAWHVHSNKTKNAEVFSLAEQERWNKEAKAAGDRKLARDAAAAAAAAPGAPTDSKPSNEMK